MKEIATYAEDRHVVERVLANLVKFAAKGDLSSPRLGNEIPTRE